MRRQHDAAAALAFFCVVRIQAGHAGNQPAVKPLQAFQQLRCAVPLQHVVDVFAFFPVNHVHHARGHVGGGQRVVEPVGGIHAGAFAGFRVHGVGVVQRNQRPFAAQQRPIDVVHIGHAADGHRRHTRMMGKGGLHR